MCTEKHLDDVCDSKYSLTGSCNSGITVSKKKGWYNGFHMWLNPNGIANLVSVGLLEAEGYTIEYKTGGDWTVTTPTGEVIIFQHEDEGVNYRAFPISRWMLIPRVSLSYRRQSGKPTRDIRRMK
jgi:hypothetical protein